MSDTSRSPSVEHHRRTFVGLAYRMLGSLTDAEDIVQESLLKWHEHEAPETVESPKAYVGRIVVRACLDRLKSAAARREVYVGPWLPEPIVDVTAVTPDPDSASELASDLSVALLLTLERLSPLERAAFLLHDVFDSEWSDVAALLGRSEVACRQLASRARARVKDETPRFHPSREERERVMWAFVSAIQSGDMAALQKVLADDVVLISDGGGHVRAALKPIVGPDRVARFFLGVKKKNDDAGLVANAMPVMLHGAPGLLVEVGGQRQTLSVEVDTSGRIHAVYMVLNPDKLRRIGGP